MEAFLQKAMLWLNEPTIKMLLSLAGGFAMNRWASIEKRALPLVLQSINVVLTLAAVAFGVTLPEGPVTKALTLHGAEDVVQAGFFSLGTLTKVLDGALYVATASGIQSQNKNFWQWVAAGRSILRK